MSAEESSTQDEKKQSDSTKTSLEPQNETSVVRQYSTRPLEEQGPRDLKRVSKPSGSSRPSRKGEDRRRIRSGDLPKSPQDFVGASLADGRYDIVDRLGKGSMAWVFRAADQRLETDVVVKIPKPEKLGDEIRERFQRESQLLVRLAHPHVVKVLDVGEYETIPYVVMQLLSGGTLLDKMDETHGKIKRMSPKALKSWLRGVASALDFCGKQGTVHRDVKPANILFDDDNNAYVSDFGLTKIMYGEHTSLNSSETTTGIVLGTPNYIAPEVVLGKPYDGRADQYSLGITVYHALVGKAPMQGNSATATMINQTQKRLQLLSNIRSDVPEALALAIRKSIEKDPELRFSSCEEFAEAAIDGVRGSSMSSVALSSMSSQTAHPQPTRPEAAQPKAAQSSAGNPRPKKKSRRKSSSGSSMRKPAPIAADPLDDFMGDDGSDWLADPVEALPPKRGKSTKRSKKKAPPNQGIPKPVLFVGAGVVALIAAFFVAFQFIGGSGDGVQTASTTSVVSPGHQPANNANNQRRQSQGNNNQPNGNRPQINKPKRQSSKGRATGDVVTEKCLVVLSTAMVPTATNDVSPTSSPVKLNVWDGTCNAKLTDSGSVVVSPGHGPWWGCGLEIQANGKGENLSQYADGALNFSIKSETQSVFVLGFQTGVYTAGTQTNNFVTFNGDSDLKVTNEWKSHSIPIADLNRNADLNDVTSLLYVRGDAPTDDQPIEVGNVYYTAGTETRHSRSQQQGGNVFLHETFENHELGMAPESPQLERVDKVTVIDGAGRAGSGNVARFDDDDMTLGGALEYNVGSSPSGSLYVEFDALNNAPGQGDKSSSVIFGIGPWGAGSNLMLNAKADRAFGFEMYQHTNLKLRVGDEPVAEVLYAPAAPFNVKIWVNDHDSDALTYKRPDTGKNAALGPDSVVVWIDNSLLGSLNPTGSPMHRDVTAGDAVIGRAGFSSASAKLGHFLIDNLHIENPAGK